MVKVRRKTHKSDKTTAMRKRDTGRGPASVRLSVRHTYMYCI